MRIAFITSEYVTEASHAGGLANYLARVTKGMTNRGHEVEIFVESNDDAMICHNNGLVHRVNPKSVIVERIDRFSQYRLHKSLKGITVSYALRRQLLCRHQANPFNIVQTSSWGARGLFSTFRLPIPIVTRASSYEPLWRAGYGWPLTLDQRICERLELLALKRSDAVYAPSQALANILEKRLSKAISSIMPPFVFDSIETNREIGHTFRHIDYLLFFGTMGALKGVHILAQAIKRVISQVPELRFVFVGNEEIGPTGGRMWDYVVQQAGPYSDRLWHISSLTHADLYPIISHSRGVVLPSLMNNLPNTCLEAMALGKVVIGTRGASFEQLIENGISGFLVTPGNVMELAEAIRKVWLMKESDRVDIGRNAKARVVSLLSPEHTCKELEHYFRTIIKQKTNDRCHNC